MNEQIEQRLEAEAASESQGFVDVGAGGRKIQASLVEMKGKGEGPAGWSLPEMDVEARPLASLEELLDLARSEEH
jgi:hypothetical protein